MAASNAFRKPSSPLSYGREILRAEAEAIVRLADELGADFERAVQLITAMPEEGRLVISGMGKAGFVGMKISATFASIGIPSFFLHPAEAVHGDLGRYARRDVALLLSNSGETPEMLRTLPHIRRIGCPVISITASTDSTLAKHSDVVLPIGKITEAGPLGLAPTTSTTVMLALGDALVMSIFSGREFTREQFAFFHPGGNLGRSLVLVSEIMRRGEELCVIRENISAREALHRISSTAGRPGAAAVVDASGTLCGIFTDGDLRRCLERVEGFLERPIAEVMGKTPKTITAGKLAQEALRVMSDHKIDQLVVIDEKKSPVGMVDIQDVVDFK